MALASVVRTIFYHLRNGQKIVRTTFVGVVVTKPLTVVNRLTMVALTREYCLWTFFMAPWGVVLDCPLPLWFRFLHTVTHTHTHTEKKSHSSCNHVGSFCNIFQLSSFLIIISAYFVLLISLCHVFQCNVHVTICVIRPIRSRFSLSIKTFFKKKTGLDT